MTVSNPESILSPHITQNAFFTFSLPGQLVRLNEDEVFKEQKQAGDSSALPSRSRLRMEGRYASAIRGVTATGLGAALVLQTQ